MKALTLAVIAGVIALAGFQATKNTNIGTNAQTRPRPNSNPFGVMLPAVRLDTATKVSMARQLGVTYYRTTDVKVHTTSLNCAECSSFTSAGMKLILTVRNGGGFGSPSTPPTDYSLYRTNIAKVLDMYKPAVLVVENEENSQALFYSGTPAQYHQELRIACEIAHQKGYKCTNGGLVSGLLASLVAEDYFTSGQRQKAQDYFQRTLAGKPGVPNTFIALRNQSQFKSQVQRGQELLKGYNSAGANYINFHWYIADTRALEEAVTYLRRVTGLTPMTNEVGQQNNEDPTQVTSVMQKIVDLHLPYAVWFSQDTIGFAGARSLFNPDGTIRPNGQAFTEFIASL